MPAEYGMHSSSDMYVDSRRPALTVCARSDAGASYPPEAAGTRLHRGIERRRRADGRGQHSPGSRRPAVQDGSVGRDRGKTARRRRRGERPWRPDPEQDLLSVQHPPRLR